MGWWSKLNLTPVIEGTYDLGLGLGLGLGLVEIFFVFGEGTYPKR